MPLPITAQVALRLEGAELAAAQACARAAPRLAEWLEVGGGVCISFGPASPLSQALHVGMRGPVTPDDIDRLESFFATRRSPVAISLCPHADPSLLAGLSGRGYRLTHFENTLLRPLCADDWFPQEPDVRIAGPDERDVFCETVTRGFSEDDSASPETLATTRDLFEADHAACFLATVDSQPSAGGMLRPWEGVGMMYGDATIAAFRGRGLQGRLIRARLRKAAESGCDMAAACTLAGSQSQRNYERAGFQVAYTKAMLVKDWT
jgi:GNAT superfamily N-acetyltransferase